MDVKLKGITWVGNIYQKFEAVCQEVDDIVSQDAVKYVENQVQNVGGSVKKFCSDVVQELRPPFKSVQQGARFLASKTNGSSQFMSITSVKESKKCTTETPVKNVIKSLHESNATNPVDNQQSQASTGLDHATQVSGQTSSNPLEVEDLHIPRSDVGNGHLRGTCDILKERSHVNTEQNTVESTTQLLHLVSFSEKEPSESSELSESLSKSSDNGCEALAELKENSDQSVCDALAERESIDVSVERKSFDIVEHYAIDASTPHLLDFTSLAEKESLDTSLGSESSDSVDEDTHGSITLPATSIGNGDIVPGDQFVSGGPQSADSLTSFDVSCEKSMKNAEPTWLESSLISDKSAKSIGSSGIEPCKNDSVNVTGSNSDISMVESSDVVDHMNKSQARLIASGNSQSMESNGETPRARAHEVISLSNSPGIRNGQIQSSQDRAIISVSGREFKNNGSSRNDSILVSCSDESMVNSVESGFEDIPLGDKTEPEESRTFVNDSELYAVSRRAQGLRSYKKRIQDAFARKKRLVREYELLGIWYGDADIDFSHNASKSSRTPLDSKNLQVWHECEDEWELL